MRVLLSHNIRLVSIHLVFFRLVHALPSEVVLDDVAGQKVAAPHGLKLIGFALIGEVVEANGPRWIAIEGLHDPCFVPLEIRCKYLDVFGQLLVSREVVLLDAVVQELFLILVVLDQAAIQVEIVQEFFASLHGELVVDIHL